MSGAAGNPDLHLAIVLGKRWLPLILRSRQCNITHLIPSIQQCFRVTLFVSVALLVAEILNGLSYNRTSFLFACGNSFLLSLCQFWYSVLHLAKM